MLPLRDIEKIRERQNGVELMVRRVEQKNAKTTASHGDKLISFAGETNQYGLCAIREQDAKAHGGHSKAVTALQEGHHRHDRVAAVV